MLFIKFVNKHSDVMNVDTLWESLMFMTVKDKPKPYFQLEKQHTL